MPDSTLRSRQELARLALRMHTALTHGADSTAAIDLQLHMLLERVGQLTRQCRRYRVAHQLRHARQRCLAEITHTLGRLRDVIDVALPVLSRPRDAGPIPSPRELFEDLLALQERFEIPTGDEPRGKRRTLAYVTNPIELEDVPLGRFRIELDIAALKHGADASSEIRTIALDPHPASTDSSVVHPHVRDDRPCLGDAMMPIRRALIGGRIGDVFELVHSVLSHYNLSSPYVPLSDWDGVPCTDCGRSVDGEDHCSCSQCDEALCGRCVSSCDGCDETCCANCLMSVDDQVLCDACRGRCIRCRNWAPTSQLDDADGLCFTCDAEVEPDDDLPEPQTTSATQGEL